MQFNTVLLHGSNDKYDKGATLPPIYQSSAFSQESAAAMEKLFNHRANGFAYTRIGNPTVAAFETKMAALECGRAAIACSSGMAAIFNAVMNVLQSGDEILASSGVFGGTLGLFRDLAGFGISARYTEDSSVEAFRKGITAQTKIIFCESIGNPKLDVPDIKAISELAKEYNILFIVDNTVSTPYLLQPLKLGADIVIHSSSKYINGSSNSISGVIVDSGKFKWDDRYPAMQAYRRFGVFAYVMKLRETLFCNTGACLAPFNAYLNQLGIETLGLRMERQCSNALKLAEWFSQQPGFSVNYPGLNDSPYYSLATEELNNGYGAILTVRTGSKAKAFSIIDKLVYVLQVSNTGDTKTLIIHPASTIYAANSRAEQEGAGVYDDLLRISVGIEAIEDLINDFTQAIAE